MRRFVLKFYHRSFGHITYKSEKFGHQNKFCYYPKVLQVQNMQTSSLRNSVILVYTVCPDLFVLMPGIITTDLSKQCRARSDCSISSSVMWVYTVCPDLFVLMPGIIVTGLSKQCRARSDCSLSSSVMWVYTVCPDLFVLMPGIIMTGLSKQCRARSETGMLQVFRLLSKKAV